MSKPIFHQILDRIENERNRSNRGPSEIELTQDEYDRLRIESMTHCAVFDLNAPGGVKFAGIPVTVKRSTN